MSTNNGQGNVRNYSIKNRENGQDYGEFTGVDRADAIAGFIALIGCVAPKPGDLLVTELDPVDGLPAERNCKPCDMPLSRCCCLGEPSGIPGQRGSVYVSRGRARSFSK